MQVRKKELTHTHTYYGYIGVYTTYSALLLGIRFEELKNILLRDVVQEGVRWEWTVYAIENLIELRHSIGDLHGSTFPAWLREMLLKNKKKRKKIESWEEIYYTLYHSLDNLIGFVEDAVKKRDPTPPEWKRVLEWDKLRPKKYLVRAKAKQEIERALLAAYSL